MRAKLRRLMKSEPLSGIYWAVRDAQVRQRVGYDNLYHFCTQKTASQWFRALYADLYFHRYSGLRPATHGVAPEDVRSYRITSAFPKQRVVCPIYLGYPTYQAMPKPERHKVVFILRDPRSLVVSWYFSLKQTHPVEGYVGEVRAQLQRLSLSEGLKYAIDRMQRIGLFWIQSTWQQAAATNNEHIRIFRQEDLARDHRHFLTTLFAYLDINFTEPILAHFFDRYAFSAFARGRDIGDPAADSHYRSGATDDWRRYFDASVTQYFRQTVGDLPEQLGYEVGD